jgi:hypothetical protein
MCWVLLLAFMSLTSCTAPGKPSGTSQSPTNVAPEKRGAAVQDWSKFIEPKKAAKVPVVLRVKLITAEGGNKYAFDKVAILAVLKNETKQPFGGSAEVGHYSWEPGVPKGESTIYVEPYSESPDHLWKLLGSTAKEGVSHTKPEPGT